MLNVLKVKLVLGVRHKDKQVQREADTSTDRVLRVVLARLQTSMLGACINFPRLPTRSLHSKASCAKSAGGLETDKPDAESSVGMVQCRCYNHDAVFVKLGVLDSKAC